MFNHPLPQVVPPLNFMIVEVRSYRTKPGRRAEFLEFFETRSIPALRAYGMKIVGPLIDLENPNKFVWLQSFSSMEERDRMKEAFYSGDPWKSELEAIAMPMLESYDVILCERLPVLCLTTLRNNSNKPIKMEKSRFLTLFGFLVVYFLLFCAVILLQSHPSFAQSDPKTASPQTTIPRDGQRDFDFEIGVWKTKLRRLVKPLTGSTTWVEYEGTTTVRKVWNGKANLVELDVTGPSGRIEGLSLRLYNPEARQWSLNFSNRASGTLAVPVIGEFKNGRGEFFGPDTLNGRAILVRFVISDVTPNSCHFEQAFSDDGGKTWESNWIAIDTKLAL